MATQDLFHHTVIVGGGASGITVAASLRRRAPGGDVAIVEPESTHYYQPAWTLVGGGCFDFDRSARPEASLIPRGCHWIRASAVGLEPDSNTVELSDGRRLRYEQLVLCPGIKLDWQAIPGLTESLGQHGVCSNYSREHVRYTFARVQALRHGQALFTQPPIPFKCAGAPQKAVYLSADYWRSQGRMADIDIHFMTSGAALFGVPFFAKELNKVMDGYGAHAHFQHRLVSVDGPGKSAEFEVTDAAGTKTRIHRDFDMLHVTPPQTAPDWIRASPFAGPDGWIAVDPNSLQTKRAENVFALGDAAGTSNAKTAAAVRKQAPVVVGNLIAQRRGEALSGGYDGYGSCPLTTSRRSVILAEFRYGGEVTPSFPWLDPGRERYIWWLVKRYGLPCLYWDYMLRGYEWDIPHRKDYALRFVAVGAG